MHHFPPYKNPHKKLYIALVVEGFMKVVFIKMCILYE